MQPGAGQHRARQRRPALGRGVPSEARRVPRGPVGPGRLHDHRRDRAGHDEPRGPRAEPDLRRVQRALRHAGGERQGLQPARRLPVAHRRREEEGRHPPGLRPHRLRPDPARHPDEGPRDEERRGDLPGGPRRAPPAGRTVRPDDEAPIERQPRGVRLQEALPPRGDPHDRGRAPLPREEVRDGPGEGVPPAQGRRHPRPLAAPAHRRHEERPPEEGPLPRADGANGPRAPPTGPGRGRQGPLREQAPQARRRPHGGPLPGGVHAAPQGPQVPARTLLRPQEGPADRERHPPGPAHAAPRPRPRDGQLGRGARRRQPGAGPDEPHVDDLPPAPRHEPTDAQPAALRGARPAPDAVGPALPERDPRGPELRPRQELRAGDRRLRGRRRGGGHPHPARPQHPRDRPGDPPGRHDAEGPTRRPGLRQRQPDRPALEPGRARQGDPGAPPLGHALAVARGADLRDQRPLRRADERGHRPLRPGTAAPSAHRRARRRLEGQPLRPRRPRPGHGLLLRPHPRRQGRVARRGGGGGRAHRRRGVPFPRALPQVRARAVPRRRPVDLRRREALGRPRQVRPLRARVPDGPPARRGPHPRRDRFEPDARGLHGAHPVSRAQLDPPQHDGLGHGQAGARCRVGQLPPEARHPRPPPALPPGAAPAHPDDALRPLHRAAGRPELRRRHPLLRGVQHAGCARLLEGRDRARPRTLLVLQDLPRGGTQVPRRPGGQVRDPEARRRRRPRRHGVPQPRRGRPHLPRARGRRGRRAHREDQPPEVPRGEDRPPDAPEAPGDERDGAIRRVRMGRQRHPDRGGEHLQARQGQGPQRAGPRARRQVRLPARPEGGHRPRRQPGEHAVHPRRRHAGPSDQPPRDPLSDDRRPRARDARREGRRDGGPHDRRDRVLRRARGGAARVAQGARLPPLRARDPVRRGHRPAPRGGDLHRRDLLPEAPPHGRRQDAHALARAGPDPRPGSRRKGGPARAAFGSARWSATA